MQISKDDFISSKLTIYDENNQKIGTVIKKEKEISDNLERFDRIICSDEDFVPTEEKNLTKVKKWNKKEV